MGGTFRPGGFREFLLGAPLFTPATNVTAGTRTTVSVGTPVLIFSVAGTARAHGIFQIPSHWNAYTAEVLWANPNAAPADVVWQLFSSQIEDGIVVQGVDVRPGYINHMNVTATSGAQHALVTTVVASAAPITYRTLVLSLLRKSTDAADTIDGNVEVLGLRLRAA
jgi:hypothetical protein